MEQIYILFLLAMISCPVVVGIGARWWLVDGRFRWVAHGLRRKFQNLGDVRGKCMAEITAVVGKPKSVIKLGDNQANYSWDVPQYQIILAFKDDICQGVVWEML
jgi:hypothetical protein